MNIEQSTLENWQTQCLRVVNLLHAARTTIDNAVTRSSDEMATIDTGIDKEVDDL